MPETEEVQARMYEASAGVSTSITCWWSVATSTPFRPM